MGSTVKVTVEVEVEVEVEAEALIGIEAMRSVLIIVIAEDMMTKTITIKVVAGNNGV